MRLLRTAAVLVLSVIMLLSVVGCSKSDSSDEGKEKEKVESKTAPVDKLFKGMEENDLDTFMSAFPKKFVTVCEEEGIDEDFEELLDELEDEYGDFKITYTVVDEDKLSTSDLDDFREMMEEIDIDGDDITEAWELELETVFKSSDEEEKEELTLVVFKYNGKWYLDPTSMG